MIKTSSTGLPILTYHAIEDAPSVIATDRATFLATLDRLEGAGYRPIDLAAWIAAGRPEVERGFALTFDDGLRSILDVTDELVRRKLPATVFVIAGRVGSHSAWAGQPRLIPRVKLLDWQEIGELAEAGFTIGAHGMTHRPFDRLDDAGLHNELRAPRRRSKTGSGATAGSWPIPMGEPTRVSAARRRSGTMRPSALVLIMRLAHRISSSTRGSRLITSARGGSSIASSPAARGPGSRDDGSVRGTLGLAFASNQDSDDDVSF